MLPNCGWPKKKPEEPPPFSDFSSGALCPLSMSKKKSFSPKLCREVVLSSSLVKHLFGLSQNQFVVLSPHASPMYENEIDFIPHSLSSTKRATSQKHTMIRLLVVVDDETRDKTRGLLNSSTRGRLVIPKQPRLMLSRKPVTIGIEKEEQRNTSHQMHVWALQESLAE